MSKNALIVEFNPYHGELLPGFVNYLQHLGYGVDVLMRTESYDESPFSRFPASKMPNIRHGSLDFITERMRMNETEEYDIVLFSTSVLWESGVNVSSVIRYLGHIPKAKVGTFFVEHNLSFLDIDDSSNLLAGGRVSTLLPYEYKNTYTPMVNPHYFGQIKPKKKLGQKKRILLIGSSSKERYTLDVIIYAVRELRDENFEIVIVNADSENIPHDLKDKIKTTGRLSFVDYYKEVERSDFVMTLFNSDNPRFDKYLNGTTSGTVQISLGFNVPMIMDNAHIKKYGFSDNTSVTFPFNNLSIGLQRALMMTNEQYITMRERLQDRAEQIFDESLRNMRSMIEAIENPSREICVAAIDNNTLNFIEQNKKIQDYEIEIAELRAAVSEKDAKLVLIKEDLGHQLRELQEVVSSHEFARAMKIYKKIELLVPKGSLHRKAIGESIDVYRKVKKGIKGD